MIRITITTDNDTFAGGDYESELSRIFHKMGDKARMGEYSRRGSYGVLDSNGNSVASIRVDADANEEKINLKPGDGIFEDKPFKTAHSPDSWCGVPGCPCGGEEGYKRRQKKAKK